MYYLNAIKNEINNTQQIKLKNKMKQNIRKIKKKTDEKSSLLLAAKRSTYNAVRLSKALELPISKIKDGKLITVHPDKTVVEVKRIVKTHSNKGPLTKGTVLCLK